VSRITVLDPACEYGGNLQITSPGPVRFTTQTLDPVCRYIDPAGDGEQYVAPPIAETG
jgi:hypothetical protein